MSAGIKPKDVRDPRREELPMQLEILRPEASVSTTDVETEEGRLSVESVPKPVNGVVQVRPSVALRRAQVERLRSARIGRVEVAAPGLDHAEALEVVERKRHRSVPAGREADESARPAIGDRPELRVDVSGKLLRDSPLPISSRTPIEIFGVPVVISGRLRRNKDGLPTQARKGLLQEVDVAVGLRRGR